MFENPGSKIKRIAVIGFILEAISVVITAIIMSIDSGDVSWLLSIPCGIVAAYLISLVFYAFGALVSSAERSKDINEELLKIHEKLLKNSEPKAPKAKVSNTEVKPQKAVEDEFLEKFSPEAKKVQEKAKSRIADMIAKAPEKKHTWRCECGQMIAETPCPYCGK